ncbi:MAG: c-type cytochrome [Proteobacteria bacterium]|nr:c-type cytochrome [Pseudomonadota bacterium]
MRITITLLTAGYAWLLATTAAQAAPRVEDTIAQRVQACTGCHGAQGRAASDGYYPRLAGKPVEYLYHQLLGFRDGRRQYALMANLLAPLSDAYLHEIASYFSNLDIPYPPPQPAAGSAEQLARGEALVTKGDPSLKIPACVQCHGAALMGVAPAIPALLGLPRDYLNGQLGAWRTGNRHAMTPDCMGQIAQRLAPDDISAVSQWLAARPAEGHAAESLPEPLPLSCGGVTAAVGAKP